MDKKKVQKPRGPRNVLTLLSGSPDLIIYFSRGEYAPILPIKIIRINFKRRSDVVIMSGFF